MGRRRTDRETKFARLWFFAVLRDRLPVIAGGAVVLIAGAAILVFSTSGVLRIGAGERTSEERTELLSTGDCAVRGGRALGRIEGILGPSRGIPRRRFQVALLEERRVVQVNTDEVEVVSCQTLSNSH